MEHYELLIRDLLMSYKLNTINFEKLLEFAAGNDTNDAKQIEKIKILDFHNFKDSIDKLCNDRVLVAYGKESYKGLKKNYKVINNIKKNKRNTEITAQIMSYKFPNISYYTRNHEEFIKDKKIIDILYDYFISENKPTLTANELGVLIFNDEKAFEQLEKEKNISNDTGSVKIGYALQVINKLKLKLPDHFNAYLTIEPFFYHIKKSYFEKKIRRILIIENKDTYYSFYRSEISKSYDMIIYGEGNKITSSFALAKDYGILISDEVLYFGDIDPVGFSIYKNFKKIYNEFNIILDKQYYISLIEAYWNKECPKIKKLKISSYIDIAQNVIGEEFTKEHGDFIMGLFTDKRYIPQEAISIINL
jgi:hypothetical protein